MSECDLKRTAGPGRKKGIPNKLTTRLRGKILTALEQVGGIAYLKRQAEANPVAFLSLVGKCLPKNVVVAGDVAVTNYVVQIPQLMPDTDAWTKQYGSLGSQTPALNKLS